MQKIRESLALVLIALLPFHALLVTVLTKLIAGSGHAPMTAIALWKEGLLLIILLLAAGEFLRKPRMKIDVLDGLILGLITLSLLLPKTNFLFGFKYDFIPLIAFLVLRRASWSDWFRMRAESALLIVGVILALYGIITLFLPDAFFRALGYSDLHSLYVPGGPLAAFQHIGGAGIRRIQSTMSGPNQLGLWLLIPWSVVIVALVRRKVSGFWFLVSGSAVIGIALLLTFSRSAWIGAFAITVFAVGSTVSRKQFFSLAAAGSALTVIAVIAITLVWPSVFLRVASSRDHYLRPMQAIRTMMMHPLGLGLGMAGPASNRVSDVCVHLNPGDDPSWAKDRQDLCVFVGDEQVQPAGRACNCPFLPENWYLQIGVELGVLGFLLYMSLVTLLLRRLLVASCWLPGNPETRNQKPETRILQLATYLAFLGIYIGALFLHAWEDAAMAYTVWVLIAVSLSSRRPFPPA